MKKAVLLFSVLLITVFANPSYAYCKSENCKKGDVRGHRLKVMEKMHKIHSEMKEVIVELVAIVKDMAKSPENKARVEKLEKKLTAIVEKQKAFHDKMIKMHGKHGGDMHRNPCNPCGN